MTELDRCPTCQHKVMFHGERAGCSCVVRRTPSVAIIGRTAWGEIDHCPCTTTRRQLLEQDAA